MYLDDLGRRDSWFRGELAKPPLPGHRVFFALQPQPADAARLHRIGQQMHRRLSGSLLPPQRLHITLGLAYAGDSPPAHAVVQDAIRRARTVAMPPFAIALNSVQSWAASRGPLVLTGDEGVIGAELLQARIAAAMGKAPDTGFTPHLSLIWRAAFTPQADIAPVIWSVRQFVLIHSVLGEGRHRVLARFALVAP